MSQPLSLTYRAFLMIIPTSPCHKTCKLPSHTVSCAAGVAKMQLDHHAPGNELAEPSSVQGSSRPASAGSSSQRPIQDYQLEQDLRAACDALAKAEQAQPKLHLVVLGHVDAGKSTLMGRLLHDLGWVSGCSNRPPDGATWLPGCLHCILSPQQMQLLCKGHTTQCCLMSSLL